MNKIWKSGTGWMSKHRKVSCVYLMMQALVLTGILFGLFLLLDYGIPQIPGGMLQRNRISYLSCERQKGFLNVIDQIAPEKSVSTCGEGSFISHLPEYSRGMTVDLPKLSEEHPEGDLPDFREFSVPGTPLAINPFPEFQEDTPEKVTDAVMIDSRGKIAARWKQSAADRERTATLYIHGDGILRRVVIAGSCGVAELDAAALAKAENSTLPSGCYMVDFPAADNKSGENEK